MLLNLTLEEREKLFSTLKTKNLPVEVRSVLYRRYLDKWSFNWKRKAPMIIMNAEVIR